MAEPPLGSRVVNGVATVFWTSVYFFYFLFKGKSEWKCATASRPSTKICCVDGDRCSDHASTSSDSTRSYFNNYNSTHKSFTPSSQNGWLDWLRRSASSAVHYTKRLAAKACELAHNFYHWARRLIHWLFGVIKAFFGASLPSQTLPATPKPYKANGLDSPSYNKVTFEPPEPEMLSKEIDLAVNETNDDDEPTIRENIVAPKLKDVPAKVSVKDRVQQREEATKVPPTGESFYYERVYEEPKREKSVPPPAPPPPPAKPIRVQASAERETTTPGREKSKEVRGGIGGFNREVMSELEEAQRQRTERGLSAQREMTQSCHPDMAQWKQVEESDRSAASTPWRASSVGPSMRRLEQVVSRVNNDDDNEEANFVFRPKQAADGYMMGRSVFTPVEEAEQMRSHINKSTGTSTAGGYHGGDHYEDVRSSRSTQRFEPTQRRSRTVGPYENSAPAPYNPQPYRNPFSAAYRASPFTSHTARRSKTPVSFDRSANFAYDRNDVSQGGAVESSVRQWPPPSNATGALTKDDWVQRSMRDQDDSGMVTTMCRRVVERKRDENWKWRDENGRLVDEKNHNTWKGELDTLLRDGPNEGRHWSRTVERMPTGDTRFQDVNRQYNRDFVVESIMLIFLSVFLLQVADSFSHGVRQNARGRSKVEISEAAYACPLNNDFYYHGVISSPNYPNMYPPSTKCYYYITAEPGKVLSFKFSQYDLETCCDYVTIYDGPSVNSKVLAQFGGPKTNLTTPSGTYYTTTRNAVVTFQSNEVIQRSGFSFTYNSTFSTTPCNRDILLVINGMATVGTQSNFQKQLQFLANKLTPTWQIGADKVRAMINFQTDIDYAVIWGYEDMPTNTELSKTILSLTDYVPDVTQNNSTDLECLFRYTYDSFDSLGKKDFNERDGIEHVAIVFVSSNANSEQDFYEALEFSHLTRTAEDTKIIIVGMGSSLQQQQIAQLAYANGFAFFSGYDQLDSLVSSINNALCKGLNTQCGP
ncbi:unnamed protein product [Caenorhabditis auriculariae]|uniref:CUB domain-containing protein n=1 Tax=Caenorhabditis auriculariae TaxID=2777116 RepID=A0A8S1HDB9_9PELO|nr:unnamed protein product [Caenorhabditis auriculariae]